MNANDIRTEARRANLVPLSALPSIYANGSPALVFLIEALWLN